MTWTTVLVGHFARISPLVDSVEGTVYKLERTTSDRKPTHDDGTQDVETAMIEASDPLAQPSTRYGITVPLSMVDDGTIGSYPKCWLTLIIAVQSVATVSLLGFWSSSPPFSRDRAPLRTGDAGVILSGWRPPASDAGFIQHLFPKCSYLRTCRRILWRSSAALSKLPSTWLNFRLCIALA